MNNLDDHVLVHVFSFLPPRGRVAVALTNQRFARLANELWSRQTAISTEQYFKPRRQLYKLQQSRLKALCTFVVERCPRLTKVTFRGRLCQNQEVMLARRKHETDGQKNHASLMGVFVTFLGQMEQRLTCLVIDGVFSSPDESRVYSEAVNTSLATSFAQLRSLRSLTFANNDVKLRKILTAMAEAKLRVEHLVFDDTECDPLALSQLLVALQEHLLELRITAVRFKATRPLLYPQVLQAIGELRVIQTLDLSSTQVSVKRAAILQMLTGLPADTLQHLYLNGTELTKPYFVEQLKRFRNLQTLFMNMHKATSAALASIIGSFPRLRSLELSNGDCASVDSKLTLDSILRLCDVAQHTLTHLDVGYVKELNSEESVTTLIVNLPCGLKSLSFALRALSHAALMAIARQVSHLEVLKISTSHRYFTGMSDFRAFMIATPRLTWFELRPPPCCVSVRQPLLTDVLTAAMSMAPTLWPRLQCIHIGLLQDENLPCESSDKLELLRTLRPQLTFI